MNFNASRNVGPGGLRKAKRVSDVAAMGAPSPPPGPPGFGAAPGYSAGFAPAGPPPPYQDGIQLDQGQGFSASTPAGDFGFMSAGFPQSPIPAPAQISSILHQPVVQDMALQYGNQLAAQGREAVKRGLDQYMPVSRLRYYFAVDTRYVVRKLLLIVFPFTHKDWMVKYDQDTPVQPRYDLNAPDLYIPSMGYVTYVLLAGFMLGLQQMFSPEQLGLAASGALAYIVAEMMLYLVTLYVTNTNSNLRTLDLLAFSGYKYPVMIGSLLCGLLLGRAGYYGGLLYCSLALSYFLVKTLRVQVLSGSQKQSEPAQYGYANSAYGANPYAEGWAAPGGGGGGGGGGTKRRVYFLLFVAITQPLLSWWLTYHLVPNAPILDLPAAGL